MAEKEFVLFEMRSEQFVKDIKAKVKQRDVVIDVPPLDFSIGVTVDEGFYKKLAADPRLQEVMRQGLKDQYEVLTQTLAAMFDVANARIFAHIDDPVDAYQKALAESQEKIKKITDNMVKSAAVAWKAYFKDQKEYLKYEVKIVAKLTIGTLSLTANIALLATTPFHFGIGTTLGIIGLAKTSSSMIQTIRNTMKDAESVLEETMKIYMKLTAGGKDKGAHSNWKRKAQDYTAEIVNGIAEAVLAISPLPSLTKLQNKLELSHNKVLGVNNDLVVIAKKINKQLEKIDKVQEAQKKKAGGLELTEKELKYSKKNLDKLETDLARLLENSDKVNERYERLKGISEVLKKWVDQLCSNRRDVKIFGACMEQLSTLYDIGTSFADFDGSLNAILVVVSGAGSVIVDKGTDLLIDKALKTK
jgi:hypothetical protein